MAHEELPFKRNSSKFCTNTDSSKQISGFRDLIGNTNKGHEEQRKQFYDSYFESEKDNVKDYYDFNTPAKLLREPNSFPTLSIQDTRDSLNNSNSREFDAYDSNGSNSPSPENRSLNRDSTNSGQLVPQGMYTMDSSPIYYNTHCATCEKIPSLIDAYIALLTRIIFRLLIISLIGTVLLTIYYDVDRKLQLEQSLSMEIANECEHNYHLNRCDKETLPPKLKEECKKFSNCMNFETEKSSFYCKIAAGLLAEALNDFFEVLSYDTMVKFFLILGVFMLMGLPYAQYKRLAMKKLKCS
ncbi:unnamed protein product [Moneuplotes crassus]|uniref:Brl1/Brr6 domain-containing protein n=1 Tax=Euplotes crassus TaxID=5936 RepID=A0AAD2D148_EUPCR|nr:unnamed protein product [Moneuplotes crassus]